MANIEDASNVLAYYADMTLLIVCNIKKKS